MSTDMRVAETILSQLGGNRFRVMTGAKNFEEKSVTEYNNVFNDQLTEIFESHTGMYTTL